MSALKRREPLRGGSTAQHDSTKSLQRTADSQSPQAAGAPRPFVVVCKKYSGKEVPFDRYAAEAEARAVAARLTALGCGARVVDDRFQKPKRAAVR